MPFFDVKLFLLPELKEWLMANLSYKRQTIQGARWPEVMAITWWNLWRWRNEDIFEREKLPLPQKLKHIRSSVEETVKAWKSPLDPNTVDGLEARQAQMRNL